MSWSGAWKAIFLDQNSQNSPTRKGSSKTRKIILPSFGTKQLKFGIICSHHKFKHLCVGGNFLRGWLNPVASFGCCNVRWHMLFGRAAVALCMRQMREQDLIALSWTSYVHNTVHEWEGRQTHWETCSINLMVVMPFHIISDLLYMNMYHHIAFEFSPILKVVLE